MGKIKLTKEELQTILHSATGNIKDFVTNPDGWIDKQLFIVKNKMKDSKTKRGFEITEEEVKDILSFYAKSRPCYLARVAKDISISNRCGEIAFVMNSILKEAKEVKEWGIIPK